MKKKGFEEGRRATARLYTWRSTCPTACHLRRTRGILPLPAGEVRWEGVSNLVPVMLDSYVTNGGHGEIET